MKRSAALISLNPTLDILFQEEDYSFSKKVFARHSAVAGGGLAINVARGLKSLGKSFKVYTILGGDVGELVRKKLTEEKIPFYFLENKYETRLTAIWGGYNRKMLVTPSPHIDFSTLTHFIDSRYSEISEHDFVVVGGSIPGEFSEYMCENLIRKLNVQGVKIIIDSRGGFAQRVSKETPYIIRYNKENPTTTRRKVSLRSNQGISEACDFHKQGIALVTFNTRKYSYAVHSHHIRRYPNSTQFSKETFGRGDAFLAGLIGACLDSHDFDDAVRFAIACGASFVCDFPLGNIFTKSIQGYLSSIQSDWKRRIK